MVSCNSSSDSQIGVAAHRWNAFLSSNNVDLQGLETKWLQEACWCRRGLLVMLMLLMAVGGCS